MKRTVLFGVLAALLGASAVAVAAPDRGPPTIVKHWDNGHIRYEDLNIKPANDYFTCNAGGEASLLVAFAVGGLVLRRRRA